MRLLLHTMATPELDPLGAGALAHRLGFAGLELICQAGYPCGIDPHISIDEARTLGARLREMGAPVVALTPHEKRIADEAEAVRPAATPALCRAVEVAAALGATGMRVLAGEDASYGLWPRALELATTSLRAIAEAAGHRGVTLYIENHMDTLAVSARRTVAICEAVDRDNVRILFDPANLATLGAEGFRESFELQKRWIGHVHAKDAVGLGRQRQPTILGQGGDPWRELLRTLRDDGYSGAIALEYERRWVPSLPDAGIALPQSKAIIGRCLRLTGKD